MSEAANTPVMRMAELISQAAKSGALKKAVFSKPDDAAVRRTVITLRQIGGRTVAQAEALMADNKALHKNIEPHDTERFAQLIGGFAQINLITTVGDCEMRRSKSGKQTLIGGEKLRTSLQNGNAPEARIEQNNRKKSYILDGHEPFLRLLDVSDENGRVKDKKQSKFRQINRFLELTRDCLSHLPAEGELRICDLCCGKSYLSFAAYHYFANVLGRSVRMTGVDLKPDVVEYCNTVAKNSALTVWNFCAATFQNTTRAKRCIWSFHSTHAIRQPIWSLQKPWNGMPMSFCPLPAVTMSSTTRSTAIRSLLSPNTPCSDKNSAMPLQMRFVSSFWNHRAMRLRHLNSSIPRRHRKTSCFEPSANRGLIKILPQRKSCVTSTVPQKRFCSENNFTKGRNGHV